MNSTIIFENEDHTLGNLLRQKMLEDNAVYFAAYKVPHPLENKMELRVQATKNNVVTTAIDSLLDDINNFEKAVTNLKL